MCAIRALLTWLAPGTRMMEFWPSACRRMNACPLGTAATLARESRTPFSLSTPLRQIRPDQNKPDDARTAESPVGELEHRARPQCRELAGLPAARRWHLTAAWWHGRRRRSGPPSAFRMRCRPPATWPPPRPGSRPVCGADGNQRRRWREWNELTLRPLARWCPAAGGACSGASWSSRCGGSGCLLTFPPGMTCPESGRLVLMVSPGSGRRAMSMNTSALMEPTTSTRPEEAGGAAAAAAEAEADMAIGGLADCRARSPRQS